MITIKGCFFEDEKILGKTKYQIKRLVWDKVDKHEFSTAMAVSVCDWLDILKECIDCGDFSDCNRINMNMDNLLHNDKCFTLSLKNFVERK